MEDNYKKYLKNSSREYFTKSVTKTEQQKFLESILPTKISNVRIADIACGAGTLSYHLNKKYEHENNEYTLIDYFEEVLNLARDLNRASNFKFENGNLYDLRNHLDDSFDFVFCWQTLSWVDDPQKALLELLRILKPGGKLYLSALFNLEFDVDIYSKVYNHSEEKLGAIPGNYNTISRFSIEKWIGGISKKLEFHPFIPEVDFIYEGRGLGTKTINSESGKLQVSAGMLLNWAILEIEK
jgi:ubiquinone/menaquinone biosynthesis C-methylase UbiE